MMFSKGARSYQVSGQQFPPFSLNLGVSELDTKTQNLSMLTQKYKKDATYLNTKSMYVKAAIGGIVLLVFFLYFWVL